MCNKKKIPFISIIVFGIIIVLDSFSFSGNINNQSVDAASKEAKENPKNDKNSQFSKQDLLNAVKYGDLDRVKELISQGVDINVTDDHGRTALDFATAYGFTEIANLLKEQIKRSVKLPSNTKIDSLNRTTIADNYATIALTNNGAVLLKSRIGKMWCPHSSACYDAPYVYVLNKDKGAYAYYGRIDPEEWKEIPCCDVSNRIVDEEIDPVHMKLFIEWNYSYTIIDLRSGKIVGTIDLDVPPGMVEDDFGSDFLVSPDGSRIFVSWNGMAYDNGDETDVRGVEIFDGNTYKLITKQNVIWPQYFSADGKSYYSSNNKNGEFVRVDLVSGKILKEYKLPFPFQPPLKVGGVEDLQGKITLVQESKKLSDTAYLKWLEEWNLETGKIGDKITEWTVGKGIRSTPKIWKLTPDGQKAIELLPYDGEVTVYDLGQRTFPKRISIQPFDNSKISDEGYRLWQPGTIDFCPDSSCFTYNNTGELLQFDLNEGKLLRRVTIQYPGGETHINIPYSEKWYSPPDSVFLVLIDKSEPPPHTPNEYNSWIVERLNIKTGKYETVIVLHDCTKYMFPVIDEKGMRMFVHIASVDYMDVISLTTGKVIGKLEGAGANKVIVSPNNIVIFTGDPLHICAYRTCYPTNLYNGVNYNEITSTAEYGLGGGDMPYMAPTANFSKDGKYLYSYSNYGMDSILVKVNSSTGIIIKSIALKNIAEKQGAIPGKESGVFLFNGAHALVSWNNSMYVYDIDKDKLSLGIPVKNSNNNFYNLNPDNKYLTIEPYEYRGGTRATLGNVDVYDLTTGKKVAWMQTDTSLESFTSLLISWVDNHTFIYNTTKKLIYFDILQNKIIKELPIIKPWEQPGWKPEVPNTLSTEHENESPEMEESRKLNNQALQLFNRGETLEAIDIWKHAANLAITPGLGYTANVEVLNNLGFAYYKLGEKYYSLAQQYLNMAKKVDPKRWNIYLNLGDLYSKTDQYKEAIDNYNKLLEVNPNYKYADQIRKKIELLETKK